MDHNIASLCLKYLYNQMISTGDIVSSGFVVFALNILYSSRRVSGRTIWIDPKVGYVRLSCVVNVVAYRAWYQSKKTS